MFPVRLFNYEMTKHWGEKKKIGVYKQKPYHFFHSCLTHWSMLQKNWCGQDGSLFSNYIPQTVEEMVSALTINTI